MSVGANLVVPIVLWGKSPPTHCISCVYISRDQKNIVTGCYDGQICLWQVDPDTLKMTPRCLLVGHTAPILCLSRASNVLDNNYIVSSSENGEMCTWDLVDGKCCQVMKLPYVHTNIQAYQMAGCEDVKLFCSGYYAEVLIMDPFSLEVIFMLSSKVNPDWISALHVLRPVRRKDDVVLGLTTTGTVKVWTLQGTETKAGEPYYENESKQIRCLNALCLLCCAYNQRTVLIVCSKFWQIYDAGDFSLLCSVTAPRGERWLGGDFLNSDRVILWSDEGKGYLYKLPNNSIAESKDFHSKSTVTDNPFLYCVLQVDDDKPLSCPPAMSFHVLANQTRQVTVKYLIRGDSKGRIHIWDVPSISANQLAQLQQDMFDRPPTKSPTASYSLSEAWASMKPRPAGILDQLDHGEESGVKLTASIYLPQQSRLVIGREDGSIIIVPAIQTVMLQILHGNHQQYDDWPPHQLLLGHNGRVNCLLYPYHVDTRYDKSHLVSGGVDFAVCLWDLYSGNLLHRFCVHAGEITQLLVPPSNCSPRIQKCICSVASDHSVTLLGLSERKCVVLASRHLFPVVTIKWRPLDDFIIVGCSDGTVYVWQMETGHLDRVLHGISAEEVLYACDEHVNDASSAEMGLSNPAVHFFRGLRHRNLSAIRHATQRGLLQLQQLHHHSNQGSSEHQKSRAFPLLIQGLRTNAKDPESHILFFDIEALIVQLLSEEYSAMSPGTLEAHGLINQSEYQKVTALTQSASPDAHKKIVDFLGKVKDKAENVERILKEKDKHGVLEKMKQGADNLQSKLHAKTEGLKSGLDGKGDESGNESGKKVRGIAAMEQNITMEIAQLLLSLLHAWGIDVDLDKVCEGKLGLLRPMLPVSFGVLSKGGYMSLLLPTWQPGNIDDLDTIPEPVSRSSTTAKAASNTKSTVMGRRSLEANLPPEIVKLEKLTRLFTSRIHWELSTTLTSNHLLAIIALANTLMSMNNATFIPEQEKNRKLHRQNTVTNWNWQSKANQEEHEELFTAQQAQIKQGWSLLATLHCILLPDKVEQRGSKHFKRPQVEMMARRWQHHCLEIREAAQALLLAELGRLGPKGRKKLVEDWAQYLPQYSVAETQLQNQMIHQQSGQQQITHGETVQQIPEEEEEEEEEVVEELSVRKPSSTTELKRKEATAVVLLGVIGAEFGQDTSERRVEDRRKSSVAEGFNINNNLARLTSLALTHLLLAQPSPKLPAHTQLRRAAIDLIGRGFAVWEPYLEVSKILLGLLELCCEADKLVPSMTYGLPLTPAADSCRTARHALTLIATARPAAFITCMAREVARYNTIAQNAQGLNVNLSNSVLHRAKPEILRGVELLIDKMQNEMSDLLVEVMDIILHCVDPGHLKLRPLSEVFPAVCRFSQVNHCSSTRRIAVGAKNGHIALYELRYSKCQTIAAHSAVITAVAFSPDGKFLASYSCVENRLSFWQTSSGMFGLGNSQTKCTKSYSTSPVAELSRLNPMKVAKLVWINNRTVTLMLADGKLQTSTAAMSGKELPRDYDKTSLSVTEKKSMPNLEKPDRTKCNNHVPKRKSRHLYKYQTPSFSTVSRGLETEPPGFPPLDLIPFDTQNICGGQGDISTTEITEVSPSPRTEFKMVHEDFPALPGTQEYRYQLAGGESTAAPQRERPRGIGIQTHADGRLTNIPASMVQDQYGIAGLLSFLRAAEYDKTLEVQGLGEDLTTYGFDLNAKDAIHPNFSGPFADFPAQPQDLDYDVPKEYLHHRKTKKKLPAVDFSRYNDDTLFYLFYTFVGDYKQLMAAAYLYDKEWRFHTEENYWMSLVVDQKNSYCFFDPTKWCKVRVIDYEVDIHKLAARPHVPNVSPPKQDVKIQNSIQTLNVPPSHQHVPLTQQPLQVMSVPVTPPYPFLNAYNPSRHNIPTVFTPCPAIIGAVTPRNAIPVVPSRALPLMSPYSRYNLHTGCTPPRNITTLYAPAPMYSSCSDSNESFRRKKRH